MLAPYIIYMACCLTYFSHYLPHKELHGGGFWGREGTRIQAFVRLTILIGSAFFLGVEVKQIFSQKIAYIYDKWNYFSWCANMIAFTIVIDHGIYNTIDLDSLI